MRFLQALAHYLTVELGVGPRIGGDGILVTFTWSEGVVMFHAARWEPSR